MQRTKSYILFLLFVSSINLVAQIDNSKVIKTDAFIFHPEEKSTDIQKSFSPIDKGESITLFGTLNDISKNFPKYDVIQNSKSRKMKDNRPVEKDVLVKKFWNGQDVSNVKIKTKLELGKLETNTKKIRIECRDHSYVDGDRVRLYLNEKVIRSNIILQGGFYMIDIDLKEGFNRIDIEALNQGTSGPNTAEFRVFDGNGNLLASNEWNILTGYVATLVVTKN